MNSHTPRTHGRRSGIWVFCLLQFLLSPSLLMADPAIPGLKGSYVNLTAPALNALPQVRNVVEGVAGLERPSEKGLMVHQDKEKAIIDWKSFDIGAEAWVHFDQQKHTDWVALNRIYDENPSRIYGRLTADGRVFLINQNGILFGPDSRVNVHTLVGSSLDIDSEDFRSNLLRFKAPEGTSAGPVSNHGNIETESLGSVILLAPKVENNGTIVAPSGKVLLGAGTDLEIAANSSGGFDVTRLEGEGPEAVVINMDDGRLISETGWIGMFGEVVNQDGLIRAVTAIRKNGKIVLSGTETVSTGSGSCTESPISDSPEGEHESFKFTGGNITISGNRIEHRGLIRAPSGDVKLEAAERVFLETGSRIDVSGSWVDQSLDKQVVEAQLNSMELVDDFGQKDGVLQGETITVSELTGSAIGDVSGHLGAEDLTARERSTEGGEIMFSSPSGDIIIKEGASIDFSGGGFHFDKGHMETTKLLAGQKIYDISSAPQWIRYEKILGSHEKRYERYGITEEFEGLCYGGAVPLSNYMADYKQGSDAGKLELIARSIVLNGDLFGGVEKGFFQIEESDPDGVRGMREPTAGVLVIGKQASPNDNSGAQNQDMVTGEIVVRNDAPALSEDFGLDDPGPETTVLSADKLNRIGLGTLSMYTNTRWATDPDVRLSLEPGGTLQVMARQIDHEGEIHVPAGRITLTLEDNRTSFELNQNTGVPNPFFVPLQEQIRLSSGSRLTAAGESIDNSMVGGQSDRLLERGRIDGGQIALLDKINFPEGRIGDSAVIVESGAHLDVSGGYEIDPAAQIRAGDAGSLQMQGSTLVLGGDLAGHSLPGGEGGSITLHAPEVIVSESAPSLPDLFNKGRLVLADDCLAESGFSHISLKAWSDLTVEAGATLAPSYEKSAMPIPGSVLSDNSIVGNRYEPATIMGAASNGVVRVVPEEAGPSSVELSAGERFDGLQHINKDLDAVLLLESGASIEAPPGGRISLEGPAVDVGGRLEALSGEMTLTASVSDLTLWTGSRILARGYNQIDPGPLVDGLPLDRTPRAGGVVRLKATEREGAVLAEPGVLVDVSGSEPVVRHMHEASGAVSELTEAGAPGSVEIEFQEALNFEGELRAHKKLEDLPGGTLSIRNTRTPTGSDEALFILGPEELDRYQESGFDAFTFGSEGVLRFEENIDLDAGRSLTLDAARIEGSGADFIYFSAPWIRLINGAESVNDNLKTVVSGNTELNLSGQFIDVEGSVALSGFDDIRLQAERDIMFSDREYLSGSSPVLEGVLKSSAQNLTLAAARIYPTTLSYFTIQTEGKLTTLPSRTSATGPVVSAGGRLTLEADRIEHRGVITAPMGEIHLRRSSVKANRDGEIVEDPVPADWIYLAGGSRLTVAGESAVNHGSLDEKTWSIVDRDDLNNKQGVEVVSAPEKSITVTGREVITREGAEIDVSGGGNIFAYEFLSSVAGKENPLTKEGRHVILPDGSVVLPGAAVHITGTSDIPEGTYSLLPPEFAFLPGAWVIEEGEPVVDVGSFLSEEGYTVVPGYQTAIGTSARTSLWTGYKVRPAADVLREGTFNYQEMTAGDGGALNLTGETNLVNGILKGGGLPGFTGGSLAVSGEEVILGSGISLLSSQVDFDSVLASEETSFSGILSREQIGKAELDVEGLSGMGFSELKAGDLETTRTITMNRSSLIDIPKITLSASEAIHLESGAEIHGLGEGGTVSLLSPQGEIVVPEGAVVHASDQLTLDTIIMDITGDLQLDNGILSLASDRIFILPEENDGQGLSGGLLLTPHLWSRFAGLEKVELIGRSDLEFFGDVDIDVAGDLTLDTPRVAQGTGVDGMSLTVNARRLNLLNSGDGIEDGPVSGSGAILLNAPEGISVGPGPVVFDGFSDIELKSQGDLVFFGEGSLKTDADLKLTAARITAGLTQTEDQDDRLTFETADFTVNAGNGALTIGGGGEAPGKFQGLGGILELSGRTFELSTLIDLPGGRVQILAHGTQPDEGIFLRQGSELRSAGGVFTRALSTEEGTPVSEIEMGASGGEIALRAPEGVIEIEEGAVIDVSGVDGEGAGRIELSAPVGGVSVKGQIVGMSDTGVGGAAAVDTRDTAELAALLAKLADGGFTGEQKLRFRSGDAVLDGLVQARDFELVADEGSIALQGTIDASGETPGNRVALHAGETILLQSGSEINAQGTKDEQEGGVVELGSVRGDLSLETGATIDVSGGPNGDGGILSLRAPRRDRDGDGMEDDVEMELRGVVKGASQVFVEAYKSYGDSDLGAPGMLSSTDWNDWNSEAQNFSNQGPVIEERLLSDLTRDGWDAAGLHLIPGIEVRTSGDLTLGSNWDLTSWRYAGEPGALTLRAAGDLRINADLKDSPSPRDFSALLADSGRDSWALTLVAGADLVSADSFQTLAGQGSLSTADGKRVYTESAPLRFAAGADAVIGSGAFVFDLIPIFGTATHTLSTFDGRITGHAGRDMIVAGGGAVQTAAGPIDISVGRDLILLKSKGSNNIRLGSIGSIRTTGSATAGTNPFNFADYSGGGDISLQVGRHVQGDTTENAWDNDLGQQEWSADFGTRGRMTEGIATLAGGDLSVQAGGDFKCQTGTFGEGNLQIEAGGDLDGRFLVKNGKGFLRSFEDFGTAFADQQIELFDAWMDLSVQGSLELGTILNPTIASGDFGLNSKWDLQYSQASGAVLTAFTGDVSISGEAGSYDGSPGRSDRVRVLPATLDVRAGRDILLSNEFALAPAPKGNLRLLAGKDIDGRLQNSGRSIINVSDMAPEEVYGPKDGANVGKYIAADLMNVSQHGGEILHRNDERPVEIRAGQDIGNLTLGLPKRAEIWAGRDIREILYQGQNLSMADMTKIEAGRDLLQGVAQNQGNKPKIFHGGPGFLLLRAGNSMDLGKSNGIEAGGNLKNTALPQRGSTLAVLSGLSTERSEEELRFFFNELRLAGVEYSEVLNEAGAEATEQIIAETRESILSTFLEGDASSQGTINMISSQISTSGGRDDLFIVAKGDVNVGRSTFFSDESQRQSTGIFSAAGGEINIFSTGDLNVNESRVMTYGGGDITVWSDRGDVNAGRGSKTAIKAESPITVVVDGELVTKFVPPAVGSGIRTLTFDPDGAEGPLQEPPAGDVFLFAPEGIIDAGEAGIAAQNIVLGATQVVNAENISFAVGSVGVPATGESGPSLGALAGVGNVSEAARMTDDRSSFGSAEERLGQGADQLAEQFTPKWLKVEFIGFDNLDGE